LSFRPDRYDALGFGPGGISFAADPDFGGGLKVLNPDSADAYGTAVDLGGAPWDRSFRYGPTDLRILYLTRRLAALVIDCGEYRQLFGTDVLADFGRELTAAAAEELVEVTDAAVRPTPRGMFYADAVASLIARRQTQVPKAARAAPAATVGPARRADHNGYGHM
jgi:oxygen-independent coproporphyrinogen-3 oxidase